MEAAEQLSSEQISLLVEHHGLGDLFQPLITPPEFETTLLQTVSINLDRPKLLVWLMIRILRRYFLAFSYPTHEIGEFTKFPFKIDLIAPLPPPEKKRNHSKRAIELAHIEFDKFNKINRYADCSDPLYVAELVVVERPQRDPRICGDYKPVNSCTRPILYPFPSVQETISWLSERKLLFASGGDMNKAFYQITSDPETSRLLAIRIPGTNKVIQPLYMPFGPTNAPHHCNRCTDISWGDLKGHILATFVDDTSIPGDNAFLHLDSIGLWLSRVQRDNWTLKFSKCSFLMTKLLGLGYIIDSQGRRADPSKVASILQIKPPTNLEDLWTFWGILVFYSELIPELHTRWRLFQELINQGISAFSSSQKKRKSSDPIQRTHNVNAKGIITSGETAPLKLANPAPIGESRLSIKQKDRSMRNYLRRIPVDHTPQFLDLFSDAKQHLCSDTFLAAPLSPHSFALQLHIDTSLIGTNTTIMQTQPDACIRPLAFYSKAISKDEKGYWPTELECWGVMTGLQKCQQFLQGDFKFTIIVDHQALLWLDRYTGNSRRLLHWKIQWEEYRDRAVLVHRPGHLHVIPDALSRLPLEDQDEVRILWNQLSLLKF
jgi:hypothetical protein